jgi:hypothetical protein
MIDYTINQKEDITELNIPTNTQWGTICFAWENTNQEFINAMNSKGLEEFVNLLVNNPNTAYSIFVSQ